MFFGLGGGLGSFVPMYIVFFIINLVLKLVTGQLDLSTLTGGTTM
jgi:hypothetical protein